MSARGDIDGVMVHFLHINHLIAAKKAADIHKDQIDVIYLEKIKQLQDNIHKSSQ